MIESILNDIELIVIKHDDMMIDNESISDEYILLTITGAMIMIKNANPEPWVEKPLGCLIGVVP